MLVDNEVLYRQVATSLAESKAWVVDVETNGLDSFGYNQICGIGIATVTAEETYYFPIRHQQGRNLSIDCYKDLLTLISLRETLIGYNLKFDLHFLIKDGLRIQAQTLVDVIVMVRLTEPSDIKDLSLTGTIQRSYGDEAAQYDIETKKYLRSNKWHKDFSLAPPSILGPYCEQDVQWTRKLYLDREVQIQTTKQMDIWALEIKLTSVLLEMENKGISIDTSYAIEVMEKLQTRKEELSDKIFNLVGEFNINSTKQMGEVLNGQGIFSPLLTPKAKQSWNEAALAKINSPVAGYIRQYRTLEKLRSTYIEPYLETKVLHTGFCNWGTVTGRLSSRNPNLQNIPRNHFKLADVCLSSEEREEAKQRINAMLSTKGDAGIIDLDDEVLDTWSFIGDESYDETDSTQVSIRRLFVPRPDHYLVSFDYSQMEVRVFLSYLRNDEIQRLLERSDVDFHGEAAKLAFGTVEDAPDFKFFRQMAKAITFGTIYGIGNKKLGIQLGTTSKEAGKYKKQYFSGLKGSREFFNSVVRMVETRGWIKNRYGRKYRIPHELGYKGVNYLVQGTSADILNERLIQVSTLLKDKLSRVLLQLHDEIICEVHESELEEVPKAIAATLEQNSLEIPLFVDTEICHPYWAQKISFDEWMTRKPSTDIIDYIDWS